MHLGTLRLTGSNGPSRALRTPATEFTVKDPELLEEIANTRIRERYMMRMEYFQIQTEEFPIAKARKSLTAKKNWNGLRSEAVNEVVLIEINY